MPIAFIPRVSAQNSVVPRPHSGSRMYGLWVFHRPPAASARLISMRVKSEFVLPLYFRTSGMSFGRNAGNARSNGFSRSPCSAAVIYTPEAPARNACCAGVSVSASKHRKGVPPSVRVNTSASTPHAASMQASSFCDRDNRDTW